MTDLKRRGDRLRRTRSAALASAMVGALLMAPGTLAAQADNDDCELPNGTLTTENLPEGESVLECDAVGRVIRHDGVGITVPEPGVTVSLTTVEVDGGATSFALEVEPDGTVAYTTDDEHSLDAHAVEAEAASMQVAQAQAAAGAVLSSCEDTTYELLGFKEYDTWKWRIGDGSRPGGLEA